MKTNVILCIASLIALGSPILARPMDPTLEDMPADVVNENIASFLPLADAAKLRSTSKASHVNVNLRVGLTDRDPAADDYAALRLAFSRGWMDEFNVMIGKANFDADAALQWAYDSKQDDIAKLLIEKADPTANDYLAIGIAIDYEMTDAIHAMIQDPRVVPQNAFRMAVSKGKTEAVRLLLKFDRVQPESADMYDACDEGYSKIVQMLLDDGRIQPPEALSASIIHAGEANHPDIVRMLLEDGRAHPGLNNNLVIITASERGYVEVVKALLNDQRTDPAVNQDMPIEKASKNGHLEVVRALMNDPFERVNPAARNNAAYNAALLNGHEDIAELLTPDLRAALAHKRSHSNVLPESDGSVKRRKKGDN